MNASLTQLSTHDIGYLLGVLVGLSILLAIGIFAVICIVKAFTKRTAGWIVAGCVSGALLSVPVIAFLVGVVSGFQSTRRAQDSALYESDTQSSLGIPVPLSDASSPKSAAAQVVHGRDVAYSLRIPVTWTTKRGGQSFDTLNNYKSLYVGVVAEEVNLGDPQTIADVARDNIKEIGTGIHWTEPTALVLDGRSWLQFTVDCKIGKIPISYQFYVYSGREGSFQIVGWTTQDLFNRDASLMREVMQTFRFPE